jgi:hypothetical protein
VTAEVGVLNSIGVALAADSAVSVGRDADKIYPSANKIFQLSCSAPVAVMIYGNANLAGLPWETIIKVYRKQLGDTRFDTVREYGEDLVAFLASGKHGMFPKKQQDRHAVMVVFSIFEEIDSSFRHRLWDEARAGNEPEQDDIAELLHDQVLEFLKYIREVELLPGFSEEDVERAQKRYGKEIAAITGAAFPVELAGKTMTALKKLGAEILCRNVPTHQRSGVVIAGFGEKQYMPAIVSHEIEEMALGRLRHIVADESQIGDDSTALVIPFAQGEMVYSFMEGIDGKLLAFMETSTNELFAGAVEEIVKLVAAADPKMGKNLAKAIEPRVPDLLGSLTERWKKRRENYWKPVVSITSSLPKDEIAAMAEALVNLTKFRRRVTTDRETVGGPIDVAVITKGDGFVWVKRKHYFSPEYNPRVIARYQQGG